MNEDRAGILNSCLSRNALFQKSRHLFGQNCRLSRIDLVRLAAFRRRYAEIFTDFCRKMANNVSVAGYSGSIACLLIVPPRVLAALAKQFTPLRPQVTQELFSLHIAMRSSK